MCVLNTAIQCMGVHTNERWELVAEKGDANGWQDGGADGEQHKEQVAHEVTKPDQQQGCTEGDDVGRDAHDDRCLLLLAWWHIIDNRLPHPTCKPML